ncbi:uncharacterized protein LOC134401268 [Elgaria multicarinata webbii]|uniref:uncharacterized protein LOC134401268 n=1 Tax=Elgaria multicarinata webbii TaxID=159646 RepID=UPI002FCCC194
MDSWLALHPAFLGARSTLEPARLRRFGEGESCSETAYELQKFQQKALKQTKQKKSKSAEFLMGKDERVATEGIANPAFNISSTDLSAYHTSEEEVIRPDKLDSTLAAHQQKLRLQTRAEPRGNECSRNYFDPLMDEEINPRQCGMEVTKEVPIKLDERLFYDKLMTFLDEENRMSESHETHVEEKRDEAALHSAWAVSCNKTCDLGEENEDEETLPYIKQFDKDVQDEIILLGNVSLEQIDWSKKPQPIQIQLKCLRGLKDKVPQGSYILKVSLRGQLGGKRLCWSKVEGQQWAGTLLPVRHNGNFYDVEISFDQSIHTYFQADEAMEKFKSNAKDQTEPHRKGEIRDSVSVASARQPVRPLELQGLIPGQPSPRHTPRREWDRVSQYSDPQSRYGYYQWDRYRPQQFFQGGQEHYQPEGYYAHPPPTSRVCQLPLPPPSEHQVSTVSTPRHHEQHVIPIAASTALPTQEERLDLQVVTLSSPEGNYPSDSESAHSLVPTAPSPDDAVDDADPSSPSDDMVRFSDHMLRMANALGLDIQQADESVIDPIYDVFQTTTNQRLAIPIPHALKQAAQLSWKTPAVAQTTSKRLETLYRVREDEAQFLVNQNDPRNANGHRSPGIKLDADEAASRSTSYLEELEKHKFSVRCHPAVEPNVSTSVTKHFYFGVSAVLSELGRGRWYSWDFWFIVLLLALLWFVRMYLHYCSQWVLLQAVAVPVTKFQFYLHTVDLCYQNTLVHASEELAMIAVGPLTLNIVMLLLVLVRWGCQLLFGSFPSYLSKLIMAWGLWTVLDPLAVFVVDAFLGRLHYTADKPIADSAKLYWLFLRTEESGIPGALITMLLYTVLFIVSSAMLYLYLVRIHNEGWLLDMLQRIQNDEATFFVPFDLEISNQELSYIVKKAEQWRGISGERRKVVVYDYLWKEHVKEPDISSSDFRHQGDIFKSVGHLGGITVHVVIYTLHLGGFQKLYRHFLRLPSGAIVEAFGDISGINFANDEVSTVIQEHVSEMDHTRGASSEIKLRERKKNTEKWEGDRVVSSKS